MTRRGIVFALIAPMAYGADDIESCALLQTGKSDMLTIRQLSVENATSSWCSGSGSENCLYSKCCANSNDRCYQKNDYWAACLPKDTCQVGMTYPYDPPAYKTPWACKDITAPPKCAQDSSVSCLTTKCCANPSQRCYQKNAYWAACLPKDTCHKGMTYPYDPPAYQTPWDCTDITEPSTCAADSSVSCMGSRCCADQGYRCYEKNQAWAACLPKGSCTAGMYYPYDPPAYQTPWSCKDITGPIVPPQCPPGHLWMPGTFCWGTELMCNCNYCDNFMEDSRCANACRVMNGYLSPPPGISSPWKAHANLAPVNVSGCDCSWMAMDGGLGDNCKECTPCAEKCRIANPFPQGTCR